MRRLTSTIASACAGVLLMAGAASAQAPDTKQLTFVTFSAPVTLPGVTLPAGSYAFKLADSPVNRNIVQVFDRDQQTIYATIIAVPAERSKPADETIITFRESPTNMPPAIQYWYYPGETRGQEFAYPKDQAMKIANATHAPVLSIDASASDAEAMKSATITRLEPSATAEPSAAPAPEARAEAAPPAQQPEPQPAPAARETTPSPVGTSGRDTQSAAPAAPAQPPAAARDEQLPKTGSSLPLLGLAGALAILGALSIRSLRYARARS